MIKHKILFALAALVVIGTLGYFAVSRLPPEAKDDKTQVVESESVTINVLENDRDRFNRPLQVASVSKPEHGEAAVAPDHARVTYTPASGYYGEDSFTYQNQVPSGQRAEARVHVTVQFSPPVFHLGSTSATLAQQCLVSSRGKALVQDGFPLSGIVITGLDPVIHDFLGRA